MQIPDLIAFVARDDPAGLEIRVNFGLFAGRDATAAELDDLAHAMLPEVGEVSVVAEQRHEVSEDTEVSVHQVWLEIEGSRLPDEGDGRHELVERLTSIAEDWARSCISERHAELSDL